MNIVDIIILVLILATVLRGIEIGFVRQFGSLVGLLAGLFGGAWLAARISTDGGSALLIMILVIVLSVAIGEYVSVKIKMKLHETRINGIDRSLGALMGIVTCLALVWFGSALVSAIPARDIQQGIRDSRIIAWLDANLPPITSVAASFEQTLAETGLPDLLGSSEPELDMDSVAIPPLAPFNAIVSDSKDSILEIEGRSCQGIGVGTGFVVENGLIVTNAHVVAGMRTPYVRDANGRQPARVVAFDEDLDIAVLRVNDMTGQPLRFSNTQIAIEDTGVVLGYPNGGPFTARPAAVADTFRALGRDIYNEAPTSRDVIALRANIEPGNSGGPLLDENGDVTGVIFARSTTYQAVGYAVTAQDVQTIVAQAQTAPSDQGSLRCI